MIVKHTPLPWKYDGDGFDSLAAQDCGTDGYTVMGDDCYPICDMIDMGDDDQAEANAALIVKAVNSYDEILKALKALHSTAIMYRENVNRKMTGRPSNEAINMLSAHLLMADRAIKKDEAS